MAESQQDDFIESVKSMAERIGLKGKEADEYIMEHAKRAGYRIIPQFVKDNDDRNGQGSFFGSGKKDDNKGGLW